MGGTIKELLEEIWAASMKPPSLVVCDAKTELGKYILKNRDGETDFDGFHHAYIKRPGQTFLVPLWEHKED